MNLLSPTDLIQFALLIVCGVAFYRAGVVDGAPAVVWAAASMGTFALTWLVLRDGVVGNLVGQGAVLLGIAVVRAAATARRG